MTTTDTTTPETDEALSSAETTTPPDTTKEAPKSQIPVQKFSRFGPQAMQAGSRFGEGKGNTNLAPNSKQRPGRAAGRGR